MVSGIFNVQGVLEGVTDFFISFKKKLKLLKNFPIFPRAWLS